MKRFLCIIFVFTIFIITHVQAQKITLIGKVVDENDEPLIGASVFFEGTTIGSSTDIDGLFRLTIENRFNASFVISFIGYQTKIFDDYSVFLTEEPLKVVLPTSTNTLKEVIVQEPLFSRTEYLEAFRENFIGDKKFWKECRILNEEDIQFIYDKDTKTFTTSSDVELQIENDYLGYKIYYTLINFQAGFSKISVDQVDLRSVFFSGISRYVDSKTSRTIMKKRGRAYENSSLQFFRWLAKGDWNDKTFQLFERNNEIVPKDYLDIKPVQEETKVSIYKQEKTLRPPSIISELTILHKRNSQSHIIFKTESFLIVKFGLNTEIDMIIFSGSITQKRISEMLPLDYGTNF